MKWFFMLLGLAIGSIIGIAGGGWAAPAFGALIGLALGILIDPSSNKDDFVSKHSLASFKDEVEEQQAQQHAQLVRRLYAVEQQLEALQRQIEKQESAVPVPQASPAQAETGAALHVDSPVEAPSMAAPVPALEKLSPEALTLDPATQETSAPFLHQKTEPALPAQREAEARAELTLKVSPDTPPAPAQQNEHITLEPFPGDPSTQDIPLPNVSWEPIPQHVQPAPQKTEQPTSAKTGPVSATPDAQKAQTTHQASTQPAKPPATFSPKIEPSAPQRSPEDIARERYAAKLAKQLEEEAREPVDGTPGLFDRAFAAARNWLFGGNTVVRLGVLLLFLGLAFLLRYASERVSIPIEFRYIGVALSALALWAVGWKLRLRRPAYALILQGAGVGTLYLTIFAALRLHPLLSPGVAFALLIVVTICLAALAVSQNAVGLAVAAALGGFAAPILTSTNSGNHVALFSYFILLNAGILTIAWFKAWRQLNLVGFVGTFGIGFAWGIKSYHPALFGSTEPFLIVFFLMYVAIGLLFSRRRLIEAQEKPTGHSRSDMLRWSVRQTDYVDGTTMFGPPLIGFGLQYALVQPMHYGAALSALCMGLLYLGLAWLLRRTGQKALLLSETCLALGTIFATLSIPLGLDARWTSAVWSVEAAGIYWLGLRQHRLGARGFSMLVQAGAIVSFLRELTPGINTLIDGAPLGAFMLGASLVFTFWLMLRTEAQTSYDEEETSDNTSRLMSWEKSLKPVLAWLGMGFLYLIAPLSFGKQGTIIAWAIAGMLSMLVSQLAAARLPSVTSFTTSSTSIRYCGLAIQILAALFFCSTLSFGFETLIQGEPLVALTLGITYLASAFLLHRAATEASAAPSDWMPALSCIGLGFLYLMAPLCFQTENTAIAWAIAGLLTVLAGSRLNLGSFLGCGRIVQILGGLLFLTSLGIGEHSLIQGEPLGAIALGVAALGSAFLMRRTEKTADSSGWMTVMSWMGLGFLYLTAPLLFKAEGTAIAWAIAGLVTLFAGLRVNMRSFLSCGLLIQFLSGVLFLVNLTPAAEGAQGITGVLDSGWHGLAMAALIGFTMMSGVALMARDPVTNKNPVLMSACTGILLTGLVLLNLAVLFVLPWRIASGVWAGTGLLIVWLSLQLRLRSAFLFGLVVQVVGGVSCIGSALLTHLEYQPEGLRPFAHAGFWTPAALALAGLVGAWLLYRKASGDKKASRFMPGLAALSNLWLLWGLGWWVVTALTEIQRFVPSDLHTNVILLVAALSVALWSVIARTTQWRSMALSALVLIPLAWLLLLQSTGMQLLSFVVPHPAMNKGWLVWPILFIVHFISLRTLASLLPKQLPGFWHVLGCLLVLTVPTLELHYQLAISGEQASAWGWLGWAILPCVYLLLMSSKRKLPWPVSAYESEYRIIATIPVAAGLLVWLWMAAIYSTGNASPLPYLPVLNPLEIGLMIALFACTRWLRSTLSQQGGEALTHIVTRASLFLLASTAVCRAAYHYGGVPYMLTDLTASILVQASWSLVWTLMALALMIFGNRHGQRDKWITGAALIGVVVVKLFFVELGNSGSLGRIVSFIGVGVLLLIIGYFAPLPPRRDAAAKDE